MPRSSLARAAASAVLAGAIAAGCAGVSPFGSASTVDRTFVGAAQTWDLNKDNVVACDEWKKYTGELFQSADADRDGAVSGEEYAAITRQDKLFESVGFAHFDGSGDGRLTLAEFSEKPNPAFALLDKNKDCQIDGAEIVQTRGPPPKDKETFGDSPNADKVKRR